MVIVVVIIIIIIFIIIFLQIDKLYKHKSSLQKLAAIISTQMS